MCASSCPSLKLSPAAPTAIGRRTVFFGILCLATLLPLLASTRAEAATPSAETIIAGRILNPTTGEYIADAEVRVEGTETLVLSQAEGRYTLTTLPAGRVTLNVSFTGYRTTTVTVDARPGETVTRDIELASLLALDQRDRPIQLDAFVVASEPEGSAKALMSQRAAVEAKNVIAIDAYGEIPARNIAEVMKYTPGVELDYSEDNAQSVRMGGMQPKYGGITVDGMAVANSIDSRQPQLSHMGAAGVSRVEVNKVGRPDIPANAPAGSINLVSRSAFERKGRLLTWQLTANANGYNFSLGKRPRLGGAWKHLIGPGGSLEYSESFLNQRLGITASVSRLQRMNEQKSTTLTYNYAPTAASPEPAVVTQIAYTDGPFEAIRSVGSFKLDFRASDHLTLSVASQYNYTDIDFFNRTLNLVTSRPNLAPGSNLTTIIARPTTNEATRIGFVSGLSERNLTNARIAPRLTYKRGSWDVVVAGTYSSGKTDWGYGSNGQGFMGLTVSGATYPLGWTATRRSENSPDWKFIQTSGTSIYDPRSRLINYPASNVVQTLNLIDKQTWAGRADATWTTPLRTPSFLKAGVNFDQQDYLNSEVVYNYTYVGPSGNRLESPLPSTAVRFDPRVGGNIFTDDAIPVPDSWAVITGPASHLVPAATNLTSPANLYPDLRVKESIAAAYLMGGIRPGKLAVEGGLRAERTRTEGKRYERNQAIWRSGEYDDIFRFMSAKYRLQKSLWVTAGYGESTLRPDLANLTGRATVNDTTMTGSIANPDLRSERATKTVARVEFYFEPAGTLSGGYFVNDLRDRQVQTTQVPAEDIGLGGTYPGYLFTTTVNRGDLKIDGFELEYRQRFTFLPGLWKGLGVVASYTKNRFSDEAIAAGTSPALANGGLMFSHPRLNASLLATWTDDTLTTTGALRRVRRARTLLDANLSVRVYGEVRAFVNIRNLTNAPAETYENVPDRLFTFRHYGVGYTFGLSGAF